MLSPVSLSLANRSRFAWMILAFGLSTAPSQAQFRQTAGPGGGHVNAFTVAEGDFYVGTYDGVYRSTDQGRNWKPAGLVGEEITTLASMGNLILAGTNVHGLFRSRDAGKTWTQPGPNAGTVLTLAILDGIVFRANLGGSITASSDSGLTSERWMKGLPTTANFYYVQNIAGKVYAFMDDLGAYTFSLTDTAWSPVPGSLRLPSGVMALAVTDSATFIGTLQYGLFRVGKNDTVATKLVNGLSATEEIRSLAVKGAAIFASTDTATFRSLDQGNTWSRIGSLIPAAVDAGGFFSVGTELYLGSSIGFLRLAATGDSWVQLNAGLSVTNVTSFASLGSDLFAGTLGDGIFRTSDAGATWTPVSAGLTKPSIYSLLADGNTLWAAASSGIYRSDDRGANWTRQEQAPRWSANTLIRSGDAIVAGTDFGSYRSVDGGATWTGPGAGLPTSTTVFNLAKNDAALFAATDVGVVRSSDDGASWTGRGGSSSSPNYCLLAVGSDLYAGGEVSGRIAHSADNGATWGIETRGLTEAGYIYSVASENGFVFAGSTSGKVYRSSIKTANWTNIGDGLAKSMKTKAMAIFDGILFVGAELGGVWKRALTEVTALPRVTYPEGTDGSQAISFPEGCLAPGCQVDFGVPLSGRAVLELYDTRGEKVETLFAGEVRAGGHRAFLTGSELAAGIYFLRLRSPGLDQTRRVLVGKTGN